MTHLKEGDKAPDFTTVDEQGNQISLSDFRGKKVILYFYPADNTPTCTKESCNFRDNYDMLLKQGFVVLGVSKDTAKKHQNFIEKFDLPFPLLVDTEKEIINAYGVWGPKKFMGREFDGIHRETFVIDENGMIERVFLKVKSDTHTEQILETYNS